MRVSIVLSDGIGKLPAKFFGDFFGDRGSNIGTCSGRNVDLVVDHDVTSSRR